MLFNPPADSEIEGGDYLVVMGEPLSLSRLEQMLAEVKA
jgi:K+/H+ antiporter YhaU regulatory subunit KhtT